MSAPDYVLIIGNKNYSSWSLRPWLVMRMFDIPFSELNIDIYIDQPRERILEHVPSAKVPALKAGDLLIWDTMAIIEFLAEAHPDKPIWPQDRVERALARAVSAEMHSGFTDLRTEMPMDMVTDKSGKPVSDAVALDVARIIEIWRTCRSVHGSDGDFLFGDFCAADAMYAPVTSRFRTYGVDLSQYGDDGTCSSYCKAILSLEKIKEWMEDGQREMA